MAAKIIDGKAAAQAARLKVKSRVEALRGKGITPGLCVVMVGDNPASSVYVRHKVAACSEAGIYSDVRRLPGTCTEAELLACIDELNHDSRIHGVIVQLPLPAGLDATRALQSLAVGKDVDGFSWRNLGALLEGHPGFVPCTPLGVMRLLDREGIAIEGRHAVGGRRSSIVGKPAGVLLLARHATVTICHSRTPDLARYTREADILVAAVGKAGLIKGDMIKPGAVVIDVGMNRLPHGKLAGDVDYESCLPHAGWITPVPGGVGPMTVAMLLENTVTAAERTV